MLDETTLRQYWAPKLWQQKGYDSESEFLEHDRCFACSMEGETLIARKFARDEPEHLLCEHCYSDSQRLSSRQYCEWFDARSPLNAIAAYMRNKVARLMMQHPEAS